MPRNEPPKSDAATKLSGACVYTADIQVPEPLYARMICAPAPAGIIRKINLPTIDAPDAFHVIDAGCIPGKNRVPEPVPDQPLLAEDRFCYQGQPIMLVAYPDPETLRRYCAAVTIEYDPLPAVTEPDHALNDETRVFGRQIVIEPEFEMDIDPNWLYVRGVYTTPHQEQAYLEPQSVLAVWEPQTRTITVTGSFQCPYFVKEAVETILGDPTIHVVSQVPDGIGGAFGGKEDFPNIIAGLAALMALRTGKPVMLVMERDQDVCVTTKRHPSATIVESWTDRDTGRFRRLSIDFRLDAGAFQTLSPVVLARGILHASGAYLWPWARLMGRLFHSDTPPNGAFRGFGAPQSLFAIESHIDDIAAALHVDPSRIRWINMLRSFDAMPTGQETPDDRMIEVLEKTLARAGYMRLKQEAEDYNRTHDDKFGVGVAFGLHGGGYTGTGEVRLRSRIRVVIGNDATVSIHVSSVDMGQGARTTLAMRFSEGSGHPIAKTVVVSPDTSTCPNSGPTVASRTIYIVGNMLYELGARLRQQLGEIETAVSASPTSFPREFFREFTPDSGTTFDETTYRGSAYRHYSHAACVVQIHYDPDLCLIKPVEVWAVFDVGKVVHRGIAEGQAIGGIVQALGWSVAEVVQRKGLGRIGGLTDYAIPTCLDVPTIHVDFIREDEEPARGLGEIPMDFPAAAVRNALYHATGLSVCQLPMTPELLFRFEKENHHG